MRTAIGGTSILSLMGGAVVMDIESVIQFKVIVFSIAWLAISLWVVSTTNQEFTLKTMAICLAPMIIFAAWFMVFYWG